LRNWSTTARLSASHSTCLPLHNSPM
jgi:hypothetical protein